MWREGINLALFAWSVNIFGLAFGVFLGARGLIDPNWVSRLVRLQPDEQAGGFAEFRATYGGVFLCLHAAALLFSAAWFWTGAGVIGAYAAGASAVVAAGWGGAAFGRAIAIWRDKADTKFNRLSAVIEAAMALAIGLPWLIWYFSSAG